MDRVRSIRTKSSAKNQFQCESLPTMPLNVRAVFISDVHLGFSGCSAEFLTDFLGRLRCDVIYLVGDIIDFINLRKRPEWVASHSMVIEKLLEMTRSGTRVIYVPGNHDEALRHYVGLKIGLLEIHDQFIHTTADQRRILVTHGDQFDSVVRCSPLLALIGTWVYDGLLKVNGWLNWCRQKSGREYWSLATFVKTRVRNAMEYIDRFEQAVMAFAHKENVDGVICGHIHRAEIRHGKGLTYMNCGDWVESCTALVEHRDGRIELLQWREKAKSLKADQVPMNEPDLQGRAA